MELYLLKSVGCLAILFIFYKAVLEHESFHNFKRFYLIGSLLAAFLIPLITFTEYIEVQASAVSFLASEGTIVFTEEQKSNIPFLLIGTLIIYSTGLFFFGMKFFRNLANLVSKIRKNPTLKNKNLFHVLLKTPTVPHTFLHYIFLNKTKFEKNEIPSEVIIHEEAHALQKHSLDILLIELLQVIFWFNPLLYFIKHSIKLNHEFLADRAVLNHGVEASHYQKILLAFSSSATTPPLANSINYSFIKKRFTVMKNQTSKRGLWLRSFILLPLLAMLIYGFSSREIIEKEIESNIAVADAKLLTNEFSNKEYTARSISIEVVNDGNYMVEGIKATKKTMIAVVNSLHQDITPEVRNKIMNIHISSSKEVSNEDVWLIYNSLLEYGFYRIVTHNQEVVREKGNKPFAIENKDSQENIIQTSASREEMKEYNVLAKKYNAMLKSENVFVRKTDVDRLTYIHNKMSAKQRADAASFPNLPPPPPPPAPDMPEPPKAKKGEMSDIPPPPPPPPAPKDPLDHVIEMSKKGASFYLDGKKVTSDKAIEALKKNRDLNIQISKNNGRNVVKITKAPIIINTNNQTATNANRTVEDEVAHFKKLADEGAQFLLFDGGPHFPNGEKINLKKAIEVVKKVNGLTVDVKDNGYIYKTVELRMKGC